MTSAADAPPRLEAERVSVRYGDVLAVADADLEVGAGEVVALLGPSGCGKSSLLHAIAGLVPHAGRIRIDGRDVTGLRPDQRDLGLMFQTGALFPHLDVVGNVGFGLAMQGMDRTARQARIEEVLKLVGLGGLGGRRVDALSGGQAQRVALARAIAPRPLLLLLDEPLSSLDRRLRDRLVEELPDVFAAVDAAVVHVTHDQDEAMAVADRVVVMDRGHVVAQGAPTSLWADPGSTFVARFLGWRNVIDLPSDMVPDRVLRRMPPATTAVGVDAGRVHLTARDPDREPERQPERQPAGDAAGSAAVRAGDGASSESSWDAVVVSHRFAGDHVAVAVALDDNDVVLHATGAVHVMPAVGDHVRATVRDRAWVALS